MIGDNVFIGNGCEFNITKSITIENNVLISSGCKFIDHDHGFQHIDQNIATQPQVEKPIKVCEGAWLGVNCVLLKGVVVGRGAIVGAGGIVTKNIPKNEIWAGVPATKIGTRSQRIIKNNTQLKICIISGPHRPSKCGISDYVDLLNDELTNRKHVTQRYSIESPNHFLQFSESLPEADLYIIQFAPYFFSPSGFSGKSIFHFASVLSNKKVIVNFHEI